MTSFYFQIKLCLFKNICAWYGYYTHFFKSILTKANQEGKALKYNWIALSPKQMIVSPTFHNITGVGGCRAQ